MRERKNSSVHLHFDDPVWPGFYDFSLRMIRNEFKDICLLLILSLTLCLVSCATIVKGNSQKITINSVPDSANVTIYDNGKLYCNGITPFTILLPRGSGYFKSASYQISISKKGYKTEEIYVGGNVDWLSYGCGNIIYVTFIGWLLVDPLSGAMYDLSPDHINRILESETAVSAASTGQTPESSHPNSDVDQDIPSGKGMFAGNPLVIVIGNRDYQEGTPNADYAMDDAVVFREYMEKTFNIAPVDIWLYTNATLGKFEELFGSPDLYKKSKVYRDISIKDKPSDIIFFYSGHGAPSVKSGKGYIVPVDASPMSIENTGYSIDDLFSVLHNIKKDGYVGRVWTIFDCCFSGADILKNISPVALKLENPLIGMKDSITMFSSSGSEVSTWYPEKSHGMFTYFLLKGLRGAADKKGDRKITVRELRDYLMSNVPRFANSVAVQDQHPQITGADEDPVLVKLQ